MPRRKFRGRKSLNMFAIIQWLGDEWKDTHTVVPVSWLRDFNLLQFKKKEREFYELEWRRGEKMPGGWSLHDVKVVDADENRKKLEEQAKELDEIDWIELEELKDTDVECLFNGKPIEAMLEERDALRIKLHNLEEEKKKLKEENLKLNKIISAEIPEMNKIMISMRDDLLERKAAANNSVFDINKFEASLFEVSDDSKVELDEGSGLFIDVQTMRYAMLASKLKTCVGTLLLSVFPTDVLLNSNYKGGLSNTSCESGEAGRRTPLCPKKLDVILKVTQRRFPNVTKGQFGAAVSAKLGYLRQRFKKEAGNES